MPLPEELQSPDGGTPAKKPRRRKGESPPVDIGPTCGQCKHWRASTDDPGEGVCYRNPPTVHFDEEGAWMARPFPAGDEPACGEFKGAN
jgi:hypothetical protein